MHGFTISSIWGLFVWIHLVMIIVVFYSTVCMYVKFWWAYDVLFYSQYTLCMGYFVNVSKYNLYIFVDFWSINYMLLLFNLVKCTRCMASYLSSFFVKSYNIYQKQLEGDAHHLYSKQVRFCVSAFCLSWRWNCTNDLSL